MLKKSICGIMTIFIGIIMAFTLVGCDLDNEEDDPNNPGGSSGGGNNTKDKAISVSVGNSSTHTISQNGEQWFKFIGTGETVIFETRGNVVATNLFVFEGDAILGYGDRNSSGEGSNALYTRNTSSGITYYIKVEAKSNTSGTYSLVLTTPTANIRTNPISVSVGYSSSHIISSGFQHWFVFQGTGNSVIFQTDSNVVSTSIDLYIGDSTNSILTDNKRISFDTVLNTTYYIRITGSSGTYTFNIVNGIGDGSSKSFSIPVTIGNPSSQTISQNGEHWFCFLGTGGTVVFETQGNVVATDLFVFEGNAILGYGDRNSSGEGSNARYSRSTTLGQVYFIKVEAKSNTSGTYTLVLN